VPHPGTKKSILKEWARRCGYVGLHQMASTNPPENQAGFFFERSGVVLKNLAHAKEPAKERFTETLKWLH
jgi:hypothetical protein